MSLKLNEKYADKLKEELAFLEEDLAKLSEDSPENLPKVLESDFIEYLLPYMLNLVNREENGKAFFNNWMNLVGDITLGFYVVDTTGNILFRVPRYLASFDNVNTPISDVSYITILKEFESEYERIPEKAEHELDKAMTALASMVKANPDSVNELFKFYIFLRDRYKDYYNYYKTNMYKEQVDILNKRIKDLENKLNTIDPETKDYENTLNEIDKLSKEKSELIKKIESMGETYTYNEEIEEPAVDYSDIDYED